METKRKKYLITAPVDYVMGHLRYGHFEGVLELTDEELESIKQNPDILRDYDVELFIDDWEIDGYGDIDAGAIEITEVE